MTAKELRGRVDYDVGSVLKRTNQVGRAESVVYDEGDAVAMGHFSHAFQIEHVAVGIAEGFGVYDFCVGLDGGFQCGEVVHVDDGVRDALGRECVGNQIVAAAIEIVGCHDMVAGLGNVLQGIGDGCGARGHGQTGHATLKGCHTVFKHALCGVGQTAVDVAGIAQTEAVGSMLRVAEHVARGLVDGHRTGVGSGVGLFLAYMQL